jgi:glutathione synthase/RimK-type ligase-like ATP-grasp enzyme
VIFQEEAPGTNLRVYVVGGEPVAAYEIESDELDYRGHEKGLRRISPIPPRAALESTRAAQACGMPFTGLDIRFVSDQDFQVLECNPSPMFEGIERWTHERPITDALAEYLVQGVRGGGTRSRGVGSK